MPPSPKACSNDASRKQQENRKIRGVIFLFNIECGFNFQNILTGEVLPSQVIFRDRKRFCSRDTASDHAGYGIAEVFKKSECIPYNLETGLYGMAAFKQPSGMVYRKRLKCRAFLHGGGQSILPHGGGRILPHGGGMIFPHGPGMNVPSSPLPP